MEIEFNYGIYYKWILFLLYGVVMRVVRLFLWKNFFYGFNYIIVYINGVEFFYDFLFYFKWLNIFI